MIRSLSTLALALVFSAALAAASPPIQDTDTASVDVGPVLPELPELQVPDDLEPIESAAGKLLEVVAAQVPEDIAAEVAAEIMLSGDEVPEVLEDFCDCDDDDDDPSNDCDHHETAPEDGAKDNPE